MTRRPLEFLAACVLVLALGQARAGAYEDFFKAVGGDDAGAVERLLQRGFDANSLDEQGQPGLLLVFRDGSFRVAEVLLAQRSLLVDAANASGETALMMAALKGHTPWVRRLLDRGAAIERPGWTPLHYAATGPDPAAVALLLERGARVDARSPNDSTPLMMAARYGSEESVKLLLARGADPRLRNQREMTAADFARSVGRESLAQQLERAAR